MAKTSLAVVMEKRGLKQVDVMRMAGLSKRTVSDAYHGYAVSPLTHMKIAKALGVPLTTIDPVAGQDFDGLAI
jgi:transcriptional regulator with XRE-family HTH domain